MKKTFTINISGIIFNIDDDAYNKLHEYLEHIKRHFRNMDGSEEIINDIESRIAEILQEKMSDDKQVVNLKDINEVIELMGQPSDFDDVDADESKAGEGPKRTYSAPAYKRLYRDTENRIIGGVAAGIGAYFNIDPLWVRLLFVVLTISGFGILIYILLWIVVPEARTTAERLSMRGEPINVSNIERSIKDELTHLKDKINDLADDTKEAFKKKSNAPTRSGGDPVAKFIGTFFRIVGRVFLIALGILLLLIGFGLIMGVIGAISGVGTFYIQDDIRFMFFPATDLFAFLFENSSNIPIIKITLALAVGIPILMLAVLAIRMIFGLERSRFFGPAAFNVWLISMILLIVFGFRLGRDFRYEEESTERVTMESASHQTLHVALTADQDYRRRDVIINGDEWLIVEHRDSFLALGKPDLYIEPSPDSLTHLQIVTSARGRNMDIAADRAGNLSYHYKFSGDSLVMDRFYRLNDKEVWRNQEMDLTLEIPIGQKIFFDKEMYRILKYHRGYSRHKLSGNAFIMTPEGLKPEGEEPIEISSAPQQSGFFGFMGLIRLLPAI